MKWQPEERNYGPKVWNPPPIEEHGVNVKVRDHELSWYQEDKLIWIRQDVTHEEHDQDDDGCDF